MRPLSRMIAALAAFLAFAVPAAGFDTTARAAWVYDVATGTVGFHDAREARLEVLADMIEEHLDVDTLLGMLGDRPALPTLTGGLA